MSIAGYQDKALLVSLATANLAHAIAATVLLMAHENVAEVSVKPGRVEAVILRRFEPDGERVPPEAMLAPFALKREVVLDLIDWPRKDASR